MAELARRLAELVELVRCGLRDHSLMSLLHEKPARYGAWGYAGDHRIYEHIAHALYAFESGFISKSLHDLRYLLWFQ
ncbi:hypothetical protein [Comamonas testosteroni]|uniref:hypothetical protein n=1 Tax=Comamonas testosteroni TaxID=285 RepID=UPI0012D2E2A6|nr:hypothetical protein [Comamonas testosteroni]